MNDITGLISVPQYQQCTISIVFSNEAGSSEPFILAFGQLVCVYITYYSITLTDTYPPSPNITNITTTGTINTVHFNITSATQASASATAVSTALNVSTG